MNPATPPTERPAVTDAPELTRQLARDVLSLAQRAAMPESYWHTDSRVARACTTLGITPATAAASDWRDPLRPVITVAAPAPVDEFAAAPPDAGPSSPEVWTDGACSGNPGPGGWGWITPDGVHGSGGEPNTTNQRMEIRAAIEALRALDVRPIEVVTDSQYVINGASKWIPGWVKKGWLNSKGQPVANRDLWEELVPLLGGPGDVTFRWVKGHAGHELNEAADQLAVAARDAQPRGRTK